VIPSHREVGDVASQSEIFNLKSEILHAEHQFVVFGLEGTLDGTPSRPCSIVLVIPKPTAAEESAARALPRLAISDCRFQISDFP
jgi:hypothetical protein